MLALTLGLRSELDIDNALGSVSPKRSPNPGSCVTFTDLFTDPALRGRGVGRALISAVEEWASGRGCGSVYWQTGYDNVVAMRLYDKVATRIQFHTYEAEIL